MSWLTGKRKLQVSWCIFFILATTYFVVLGLYLIDYPFWDDYFSFMDFIADRKEGKAGVLAGLWEQHYEHRIVVQRLAAWLQYALIGKVNIALLLFTGNLLYAGFVFLLARELSKLPSGNLLVIATGLWFFCFLPWETIGWVTTAWYVFPLFLATMLSILCWQHRQFVWCICFAAIAVLSGANGVFVLPAIAIVHALNHGWRNKIFYMVTAFALLFFVVYIMGYERPPHQQSPWLAVLRHPQMALRYWVVLTGYVAGNGHAVRMAIGVVGVLLLALLMIRRAWKQNAVMASLFLFALFTLLLITLGRAGAGPGQATTPRYVSFSSLYWFTMLVMLALGFKNRIFLHVLLALAVLRYGFITYNELPRLSRAKQLHQQEYAKAKHNAFSYFHFGFETGSDQFYVGEYLQRYTRLGIYASPLPKTRADIVSLPQKKMLTGHQMKFTAGYFSHSYYYTMLLATADSSAFYFLQANMPGYPRRPLVLAQPAAFNAALRSATLRSDSFNTRPVHFTLFKVQQGVFDSMDIRIERGDYKLKKDGSLY